MVTFLFGNNINSEVIPVKGTTMKNAMHWAARMLKVKEINLIFIGIT